MNTGAQPALPQRAFPVVGGILLATDLTTERDVRALLPAAIGFCATRIEFANPTTPENVRMTLPHLGRAAKLIVPAEPLAAIYFSCTSATATLGRDAVDKAIHEGRPGVPVITPVSAANAAFSAIGTRRIAIMTPYVTQTAQQVVSCFEAMGYEISRTHAMEMQDDGDMARLLPEPIIEATAKADHPEAEAIFISCTALPAATLVPALEHRFNKPVVTSNLAGIWMAMRMAGYDAPVQDRGTLMRLPLPAEAA